MTDKDFSEFVNFVTGSADTGKHLAGKHNQDRHGNRAGGEATPAQISARKRAHAERVDAKSEPKGDVIQARQSPASPAPKGGDIIDRLRIGDRVDFGAYGKAYITGRHGDNFLVSDKKPKPGDRYGYENPSMVGAIHTSDAKRIIGHDDAAPWSKPGDLGGKWKGGERIADTVDLGVRQSPGGRGDQIARQMRDRKQQEEQHRQLAGLPQTVRQQRHLLFDNPNQDAAEVTLVNKKTGAEETMTVRNARRLLFKLENQDEESPYTIPGVTGNPKMMGNPTRKTPQKLLTAWRDTTLRANKVRAAIQKTMPRNDADFIRYDEARDMLDNLNKHLGIIPIGTGHLLAGSSKAAWLELRPKMANNILSIRGRIAAGNYDAANTKIINTYLGDIARKMGIEL